MQDYVSCWTNNISELLEKLKDTKPDSGGCLSEIYYWRDMDRVLDAVSSEIAQPYVS
jgi:hypothetical protein